MKRTTVLLPLLVPRLSDQAPAQPIELLRELLSAIEHHYANQIQRHRKRAREIERDHQPRPPASSDPRF